jgi:hypothetical protein
MIHMVFQPMIVLRTRKKKKRWVKKKKKIFLKELELDEFIVWISYDTS